MVGCQVCGFNRVSRYLDDLMCIKLRVIPITRRAYVQCFLPAELYRTWHVYIPLSSEWKRLLYLVIDFEQITKDKSRLRSRFCMMHDNGIHLTFSYLESTDSYSIDPEY